MFVRQKIEVKNVVCVESLTSPDCDVLFSTIA
jgi:hypothetical protein